MPSTFDISDILRAYALRFNSPAINIIELCEYLHKHASRYVQEHPEFAAYVNISEERLLTELQRFEASGKIELISDKKKGTTVFIPFYFIDKIIRQYELIREKPELPFPLVREIPQNFSMRFLRSVRINIDFPNLQPEPANESFLYQLIFPDNTPPLIFPGTFSTDKLLELAIAKMRFFFRKNELREFIQKKLITANPGKEYSIRKFIDSIQAHSNESVQALKRSGDTYLFWSYLCMVIKQEFAIKTEKLQDELAVVQAVYIIEYLNNFYRNKTQQNQQRDNALKNLEASFNKTPYYFSKAAIINFRDSRSVPLLGQYSEVDLENYMQEKTTAPDQQTLPPLLSFKLMTGEQYYILIEKVIPLIMSLVKENRKQLRDVCLKEWYSQLVSFKQIDAMHTDTAFNSYLKRLCAMCSPVLYALLNAPFMFAIVHGPHITSSQAGQLDRVFLSNKALSYKDLFMLNRVELLTDAKILLPVWYTIPLISSIIAFFVRPRSKVEKPQKDQKKKDPSDMTKKNVFTQGTKDRLQNALLPKGKDVQQCIIEQLDLWNTNIDPVMRKENTENVNSFIRDYFKKSCKTLATTTITVEMIHSFADSIIHTSGLAKVKNKSALRLYSEYYILWLIVRTN